MHTFNITIDDAMEKAMEWDIMSLDAWAQNAINNKARRCSDEICQMALDDQTDTILSTENKQLLRQYLDNQGIHFISVKQLPISIKKEIVKRANIKSAAEREAEQTPLNQTG